MTPKEKARLLIDRFNHFDESYYHESFKDTDLGNIIVTTSPTPQKFCSFGLCYLCTELRVLFPF
jgi:hypothetical protein